MESITNVEYTGKINSVTILNSNGNPTNQATLNPHENSFKIVANIQFLTCYQIQLINIY